MKYLHSILLFLPYQASRYMPLNFSCSVLEIEFISSSIHMPNVWTWVNPNLTNKSFILYRISSEGLQTLWLPVSTLHFVGHTPVCLEFIWLCTKKSLLEVLRGQYRFLGIKDYTTTILWLTSFFKNCETLNLRLFLF